MKKAEKWTTFVNVVQISACNYCICRNSRGWPCWSVAAGKNCVTPSVNSQKWLLQPWQTTALPPANSSLREKATDIAASQLGQITVSMVASFGCRG